MAKDTAKKETESVNQTLQIPKVLFDRALKYYRQTGIKVTQQIRTSLHDFLTNNNY